MLAELRQKLREANERKQELERSVQDCIIKLERAQALIAGLGGEKGRWTEAADEFARRQEKVLGDMLLSAGITNFLGPFTSQYRASALGSWIRAVDRLRIPRSPAYSLRGALADEIVVRQWTATALPADAFSVDTAVIM